MKLDRMAKYFIYTIIIISVYTLLFGLCLLDVKDSMGQPNDREELLCVITGFSLVEQPVDVRLTIIKWMLGLSSLFILVGREVYARQNQLKYIAMIRYGSYRRFYRSLINRTVFNVLFYGSIGVLTTYVWYRCAGNEQVDSFDFFEMGIIYLSHVLLLCLLQTLFMIRTRRFTGSIILLALWFVIAICGHRIMKSGWIWLPVNWGMYIRGTHAVSGGVPNMAYYIQACLCILLWAGAPLVIKQRD